MIHADLQEAEALDLDRASIGTILQQLVLRGDRLGLAAARIIRSQEDTIMTLDNEVVEAEWRALAHAVEIERMADHRYAVIVAGQRKRAK
jgi:hypothetical protein